MPDAIDPESIDLSKSKLIGQGRTAEVYRYGNEFVLKVFRTSFPRQAIENEYLVCRSIGSLLDIPATYQRLTIDGRDAIVFECIEGESGFKYLLRHPFHLGAFAAQFAAIHARMHSLTVPGQAPDLPSILVRNIALRDLLQQSSKDRIVEYLRGLPPGTALCHGDFHPDNILLRDGKPFVLDWMTATRGNPLADVARTSVLLRWAQPGPGTPAIVKVLLSTVRKKFYNRYISEYLRLTRSKIEDVERWELPVMAARLMEWIPQGEKEFLISKIDERLRTI